MQIEKHYYLYHVSNNSGSKKNLIIKKTKDYTVEDWGRGCVRVIHHTEASHKSFNEFFNHLVSFGRKPSTKTNLANSRS